MPEVYGQGCTLPLELIYSCYRLLFPEGFFGTGVILGKPSWKDVEGLSMASKASRQVILSLWFHVLHISDKRHWATILWKWKRLYNWTRAVHYTSEAYKSPRYFLEPFRRLDTLRIDLPTTYVTQQGDLDFAAPEMAQIIRKSIPNTAIQHLEIRGITWLDPLVMRHIAKGLPNLRTLQFRQPLVWCGLCNTIGAPAFASIPAKIVYDGGVGLPTGYSRSLASLRHLHTVILTTVCGQGCIEYNNLFSHPVAHSSSSVSNTDPRLVQKAGSQVGWSGECEACMLQLLNDETFDKTWRSKVATRVSTDECREPNRPGPPSLRRVEWNLLEPSNQNWPGLLPTVTHVVH